jgi:hypothetical protein
VGGIDQQWQMDLADMQKFNNGYHYLLVCIDVFSKYAYMHQAWVVPLKNKTGPILVDAFKVIYDVVMMSSYLHGNAVCFVTFYQLELLI